MNRNEALVQLLAKSGKTQAEIARLSKVNTSQIQNWKNFKNTIRPDSLEKVADACGYKVVYKTLDDLELQPIDQIEPLEEEPTQMSTTTNMIVQSLIEDKKELKSKLDEKNKEITKLERVISDFTKNKHMPSLEPTRYQCQTKMIIKTTDTLDNVGSKFSSEEQQIKGNVFLNVTYLYAELLGYKDQFELTGKPYLNVLHPDEFKRFEDFKAEELYDDTLYVKLITKQGNPLYVKSNSTGIEFENGLLVSTDVTPISEAEYLENTLDNFDTGVLGQG